MNARVLILEESPLDAEMVERELETADFVDEVRVARSRAEFVEALAEFDPDLVLSDHAVGRFSGREALELVHTHDLDLPFILITGALDEETAVDYMRSGASDYIIKDRLARLVPACRGALNDAARRRTLARQQELLVGVLEASPNLVFVKDYEGRFLLANQAVATLYGTTVADLIGKTDADFNGDPTQVEGFLRDDREVIRTGQPKSFIEEPVTDARTGEHRWLQTVKVPLRLNDEGETYVLGIATDVTDVKMLEEQLRRSQKMEAIGRLAGGIAHDFNNLLTTIIINIEFLAEEPLGDEALAEVSEIREAAKKSAALTKQLLAFGRRQIQQTETLNLGRLVDGLATILRTLIGEDVRLALDVEDDLWSVNADRSQIEQVVMNLAINARDAMPTGGELRVEVGNVRLDEAYTEQRVAMEPGDYVVISVGDTGDGIAPEVQDRVFDPFFTTKGPDKGTGLGLATVYGIVSQTGGHVWFYSEIGIGTTFKVYFPRATRTVERARVSDGTGEELEGAETILIVEDLKEVLVAATRTLQRFGYTVLVASDGTSALEVAAAHDDIDLLLVDTVLPDTPGPKVAEAILRTHPKTRVLYMSGYTTNTSLIRGVREQGVPFLEKPFTPKQLARHVRFVLDADPSSDLGDLVGGADPEP